MINYEEKQGEAEVGMDGMGWLFCVFVFAFAFAFGAGRPYGPIYGVFVFNSRSFFIFLTVTHRNTVFNPILPSFTESSDI